MVKQKIEHSSLACQQWSKEHADPTKLLIGQKTRALADLQGEGDGFNLDVIHHLQDEDNDLIELEDLKWRQRSKQDWLLHGDKNSQVFPCQCEATSDKKCYQPNHRY